MIKVFEKGSSTPLSRNFNSNEFDCKCENESCKTTLIDMDHVAKLQKLRNKIKKSIKITSAYRCEAHNTAVGGAKHSQHKLGTATDIQSEIRPNGMANWAEEFSFDGIGRYDTFTHIDSRGYKARWDNRSKK